MQLTGSRRLPPPQTAKSYGYYTKSFLSYGSAVMVGYGVWTAVNEINRVRMGTIFSIAAGIAGWIFFRWLNKEKIIGEEQPVKTKPANSNDSQEIKELKAEVTALRRSIDDQRELVKEQSKRLDLQGTELSEFREIFIWNKSKLRVPPQSPSKAPITSSQDDTALLRRNSSGSGARRLTFDATAITMQNPLITLEKNKDAVARVSSEGVGQLYANGSQTDRSHLSKVTAEQEETSGRTRSHASGKKQGVQKK